MATVQISGSSVGASLTQVLCSDDIQPGSQPSYELCKLLYLYHPLGQKIVEGPIRLAQSLPRDITVPDGPEDECKEQFERQWLADGCDENICNLGTQARVYGLASMALLEEGVSQDKPLNVEKLAKAKVSFNIFDPLNTAGSLVLNQDPNAMNFQKHTDIIVNGVIYHRSRSLVLMHERPIYISYTSSAYGFVGRSVFQRILFPLKSFVQTMIADDMVSKKAGLLVAMMKMAGSIIDNVMRGAAAFKRAVLKLGVTENVLSIDKDEKIESLNLQNLQGPLDVARKHILENIAAGDDMPAVMLNNETFAQGFGEGTEDAKRVAQYIKRMQTWLNPVYEFFDMTTQRRAWNEEFFQTIQEKYPDRYKSMSYEDAFYRWSNSFTASWPSLLQEPESEKIKVADTKFKTVIATGQVLIPEMDPDNKVNVIAWMADNLNEQKDLFTSPLVIDQDLLLEYLQANQQQMEQAQDGEGDQEPQAAPPFSARDSRPQLAYLNGQPAGESGLARRISKVESTLGRFLRRE